MKLKIFSICVLFTISNFLFSQNEGSLDLTFDSDGILYRHSGEAFCLFVQIDGKLIVAGRTPGSLFVNRYKADGSNDNSFKGNGTTTTTIPQSFLILGESPAKILVEPVSEGNIYVVGHSTFQQDGSLWAVKYNAFGLLDPAFGNNGIVQLSLMGISDAKLSADDQKIFFHNLIIFVAENLSS